MKKYCVQNGKVVINKYCVQYVYLVDTTSSKTTSEVVQYVKNQNELNSLTNELTQKGIEFEVTEIDVSDIEQFDGLFVTDEEQARRIIEPTLDEVKSDKIKEISDICEQTIYKGVDVTLSNGEVKHFSLKIEDQVNLNRLAFINKDIDESVTVTYHADGEVCEEFSKADFFNIIDVAFEFISEQTEYCNRLMKYVEKLGDVDNVLAVSYGAEV